MLYGTKTNSSDITSVILLQTWDLCFTTTELYSETAGAPKSKKVMDHAPLIWTRGLNENMCKIYIILSGNL